MIPPKSLSIMHSIDGSTLPVFWGEKLLLTGHTTSHSSKAESQRIAMLTGLCNLFNKTT